MPEYAKIPEPPDGPPYCWALIYMNGEFIWVPIQTLKEDDPMPKGMAYIIGGPPPTGGSFE